MTPPEAIPLGIESRLHHTDAGRRAGTQRVEDASILVLEAQRDVIGERRSAQRQERRPRGERDRLLPGIAGDAADVPHERARAIGVQRHRGRLGPCALIERDAVVDAGGNVVGDGDVGSGAAAGVGVGDGVGDRLTGIDRRGCGLRQREDGRVDGGLRRGRGRHIVVEQILPGDGCGIREYGSIRGGAGHGIRDGVSARRFELHGANGDRLRREIGLGVGQHHTHSRSAAGAREQVIHSYAVRQRVARTSVGRAGLGDRQRGCHLLYRSRFRGVDAHRVGLILRWLAGDDEVGHRAEVVDDRIPVLESVQRVEDGILSSPRIPGAVVVQVVRGIEVDVGGDVEIVWRLTIGDALEQAVLVPVDRPEAERPSVQPLTLIEAALVQRRQRDPRVVAPSRNAECRNRRDAARL